MAEGIDYWNFQFERVIGQAGDFPEWVFTEVVLKTAPPDMLEEPAMGMVIGGLLVRAGMYLCEQRDPLAYYEFLQCVAERICAESDRVVDDDTMPYSSVAETEFIHGLGFLELATEILDDGIVTEPRAVAWALIRDGLSLAEFLDQDYYPHLIAGLSEFLLLHELPRVKDWPRLVIR